MTDRNDRREIALCGIDPNWRKLLSEILNAHGFSCRTFADREEAEAGLKGGAGGCLLLIAESNPGESDPDWIRKLSAAFPAVRVVPVPSHLRPTELFRFVEASLPASGKASRDSPMDWS